MVDTPQRMKQFGRLVVVEISSMKQVGNVLARIIKQFMKNAPGHASLFVAIVLSTQCSSDCRSELRIVGAECPLPCRIAHDGTLHWAGGTQTSQQHQHRASAAARQGYHHQSVHHHRASRASGAAVGDGVRQHADCRCRPGRQAASGTRPCRAGWPAPAALPSASCARRLWPMLPCWPESGGHRRDWHRSGRPSCCRGSKRSRLPRNAVCTFRSSSARVWLAGSPLAYLRIRKPICESRVFSSSGVRREIFAGSKCSLTSPFRMRRFWAVISGLRIAACAASCGSTHVPRSCRRCGTTASNCCEAMALA